MDATPIWKPIATAPKRAVWIIVRDASGKETRAHYACDLSGDEQPAFGPGYYYAVTTDGGKRVLFMDEVSPAPIEWREETL